MTKNNQMDTNDMPSIKRLQGYDFAIEGILNMQTVPELSKQLPELMANSENEELTFDLASISHSDSAGVALLVEIIQLAKTDNITTKFTNLPSQMKDIAKVSGLFDILPIH